MYYYALTSQLSFSHLAILYKVSKQFVYSNKAIFLFYFFNARIFVLIKVKNKIEMNRGGVFSNTKLDLGLEVVFSTIVNKKICIICYYTIVTRVNTNSLRVRF